MPKYLYVALVAEPKNPAELVEINVQLQEKKLPEAISPPWSSRYNEYKDVFGTIQHAFMYMEANVKRLVAKTIVKANRAIDAEVLKDIKSEIENLLREAIPETHPKAKELLDFRIVLMILDRDGAEELVRDMILDAWLEEHPTEKARLFEHNIPIKTTAVLRYLPVMIIHVTKVEIPECAVDPVISFEGDEGLELALAVIGASLASVGLGWWFSRKK